MEEENSDVWVKRNGVCGKRSDVWQWFTKVDRNLSECNLCQKLQKSCGNTTNLRSHLLRQHKDYFNSIQDFSSESGKSKPNPSPEVTGSILEPICIINQNSPPEETAIPEPAKVNSRSTKRKRTASPLKGGSPNKRIIKCENSPGNILIAQYVSPEQTEETLQYRMINMEEREIILKERHLGLEERRVTLEERRVTLEEQRLLMEEAIAESKRNFREGLLHNTNRLVQGLLNYLNR